MRNFWQTLWQDLRYALRQLRNAPGFTLTAILTLALGIGVTTTVFSVARQVLLAPLPYPQPERLVGVALTWPKEDGPTEDANANQTGESYDFLAQNSRSYSSTALLEDSSGIANLSDKGGHSSSIRVAGVTRSYFDTLGIGPSLGRAFAADEDRQNGPKALVLSYGLWQRAFGGDRSILGRTVRLNQESVTVVGVMPASFRAEVHFSKTMLGAPDAWRPLQLSKSDPGYIGTNYEMYARLRPGVSLAQAQGELRNLDRALDRQLPYLRNWGSYAGRNPVLRIWPLATVFAGDVQRSLVVMGWAATAVLLLVCLNLAGLNTARALRRAAEFGLRAALGATRARLLRLAFLEVFLLAFAGTAGALLVAGLLLPFLLAHSPVPIPQLNSVGGFGVTLTQTAVLGLLSAILFGAPLALLAFTRERTHLRLGAPQIGGTPRRQRSARALLVLQMSLAVVLLSTASLLLGTFLRLQARPLGFTPEKLVVFQTNLKGKRYAPTLATEHFVTTVLSGLSGAPGVSNAAAINGLPLDRGLNENGYPDARSQLKQTIEFRAITPGYFRTMQLPLLAGRDLAASDGPTTLHSVVISAAAARRWWPGRSPLGSSIHTGNEDWRIVGIVADAPSNSLADEPPILIYAPITQLSDDATKTLNGWFPTSFAVRLAANLDAGPIVRKAVAAADPEIPVAKLTTMQQVIDDSVAAPRFFTELAEGFAGFGVLLTAIGLFGLLSYQVGQRTREIGIRIALGAGRGSIMRSVIAGSVALAFAGAVIGGVGSLLLGPLLSRWIAENVIGAGAPEPHLFFNSVAALGWAVSLILLTCLAAAVLPARRAAQVEPMEALRTE